MNIHLIRHAECFKNLVGIPGGEGASLTPTGLIQAEKVAEAVHLRVAKERAILIACPPLQTVETAAVIGRRLGIESKVEPIFTSIDLGVLGGVPIIEASARYPESSAAMDRWRAQLSEIADLQIDGMEAPWGFYNRGLRGILKYRASDELILCSTTSIMILMIHISNKITPRPGEGYKAMNFSNAEVVSVFFDNDHLNWIEKIIRECH